MAKQDWRESVARKYAEKSGHPMPVIQPDPEARPASKKPKKSKSPKRPITILVDTILDRQSMPTPGELRILRDPADPTRRNPKRVVRLLNMERFITNETWHIKHGPSEWNRLMGEGDTITQKGIAGFTHTIASGIARYSAMPYPNPEKSESMDECWFVHGSLDGKAREGS